MEFKIGQTKRPKSIDATTHVVTFEQFVGDGLVEATPTKEECEAYGYVFVDNTCQLRPNQRRMAQPVRTSKRPTATSNIVGKNANNNIVAGRNNQILTGSNNSITGEYNIIQELTDNLETPLLNCSVTGYSGSATIHNHYVHGGSSVGDILGERQYTRVLFGRTTTTGGTVNAYINNDGTHFYPVPTNSIMYFNASIVAVCTSQEEAEGSVGDFCSWLERGVVINRNGTLQIKRTRKTMSQHGTVSNWRPTAAIAGTDFKITVRGDANRSIEWTATVDFTEYRNATSLAAG